MKPVFYIAEAPTFSTGEIMLALLILLAVLAFFGALVVIGIKGFDRLGRGERDSIPAKVAPVIGVLDLLLLLASWDEALLPAMAPLAVHVIAFFVGRGTRPIEPPPPPAG